MPTFERDWGTLYYRDSRRGARAVVLLHEYFGTGESWAGQRTWLGRQFRVITPALRGHGRSPTERADRLTVTGLAGDILSLLDEAGVETAHFVGCSLGALVALSLGVHRPERVESLAVASIPDIRSENARKYAQHYIENVFPGLERSLERQHGDGERGYSRELLLRNFALDLEESPEDHVSAFVQIENIRQRTLVIAGDSDPVFTPRTATDTFSRLSDGALAILPGTGHIPHQEQPGLFNQLLFEHLHRPR